MSSSSRLASWKDSSSPSGAVADSTLGRSAVAAMTLRHSRSTCVKRLASVGICRMMSSDEKMGSR